MREDSMNLESGRMEGLTIENYPWIHERHRIFPEIFENRNHKEIIDVSAGIGITVNRILENYNCKVTCNEVDVACRKELKKLPIKLLSFDLDHSAKFPIEDETYDAIICLATLEHIIDIDNFVSETKRILKKEGRLYFSVPNYASLYWMIPLLKGKTFHDPFEDRQRYEFYAHIRYFTYHTVVKFLNHFGLFIDTVYLPIPKRSSKFKTIKEKSNLFALMIQIFFGTLYRFSPRWHQEPVICFRKDSNKNSKRKKIF